MPKCTKSQKQIDEVLIACDYATAHGSNYCGQSFESGVRAALDWVLGLDNEGMAEFLEDAKERG